jgi:hypothetical protein
VIGIAGGQTRYHQMHLLIILIPTKACVVSESSTQNISVKPAFFRALSQTFDHKAFMIRQRSAKPGHDFEQSCR